MTLVTIPPDLCPRCGSMLREETVDEPALVRHAGYGATRRTVRLICDTAGSGSHLTPAMGEVRP